MCGTCRNREAGRPWRISLGKVFVLPPGAPDFDCPHGKPWGYEPPPGSIATPAASADRPPVAPIPAADDLDAWELCDSCDNQVWPSGGARGCKLIEDGKACALGKCFRGEWPWPEGCPRLIRNDIRKTRFPAAMAWGRKE